MPRCCSSGGAARSAWCRPQLMAAGDQPDRRRARRILPAQPGRLHHARAAGDQICADRRRAGRPGRAARPTPRSPPSTATTPPSTARARRARCSRSCCRASRRRRPSPSGCAAAPSFVDAAARPASPPRDVTFADQSRDQFARRDRRRRSPPPPSPRRRARSPARSAPSSASTSSGSSGSTTSPARPLEAVRGEIAAAIEQRKRTEALGALVTPGRGPARRRRELRGRRARRAARRRHHAADHRGRARPAGGQPWQRAARAAAAARAARSRSTPRIPSRWSSSSPPNSRFALLGIERVEPGRAAAARPDPRPQVRAACHRARGVAAGAGARRCDRPPDQCRHAAPPRAFAEAQPRLPAPQSVDMRRLDISRAGQQVPPPLITLFSMPAGPRAGDRGAEQCRLVHRRPRASAPPGNAAAEPQLIADHADRIHQRRQRGDRPAIRPRGRARRARSSRNEEAIRRARRQLGGGAAAE